MNIPFRQAPAQRRIWLCADDYGISPGVDTAIRDLVARGRLNATSVMVVAPSLDRSEVQSLDALNATERRVAIGLHVTLTAPFTPVSTGYQPLRGGAFLPLDAMFKQACLRRLKPDALAEEITAQVKLFIERFERPPDFIDGHQHVQLFPQVRDALLDAAKTLAPDAWVRQCGRVVPMAHRIKDRKGLLLDVLSLGFRQRAAARSVRTNPAFAGTYDFNDQADFAATFPRFLDRLPDGGLVMCHPGFVDAELRRLDPLTTLREQEYAFFIDDAFPDLLANRGVVLA